MIRRAEDMVKEIRDRMRGGSGQVTITRLLERGDYKGNSRLLAKITLNEGCSVGYHEHVDEEEIFYVIQGQGIFTDSSDGRETILRPGDAAVTLGGQSHAISNPGTEPLELVAVILQYT